VTPRFFLIDGHSHLYRAYHAIGYLSTSRGVPTHAVFGMSSMIWKILREESPDYCALAWDAPGPTHRHAAFEAYKVNRPGMPDDLVRQLPHVREVLEAFRIPVLEVPGYEADDLLGTVAAETAPLAVELVIVTADKDALQLVSPGVRVLTIHKGEKSWYDEAAVAEKWGVPPGAIPDLLALAGDQIDNIPGVPGIGEVTAVKLLSQFGSLARLYEHLTLVSGTKLRETLAENKKQALLSRELATISRRVPLAFRLETFKRQEPDWEKLRQLWTELEFSSLLKQLPQPMIQVTGEPVEILSSPESLSSYLARLPAEAPLAVEWVGEGSGPVTSTQGLGLFHPGAGPGYLDTTSFRTPHSALRISLIGHDVKLLIEWGMRVGWVLTGFDDSALAAYLLNPARATYRLEDLCVEAFGQGPPELTAGADSLARAGERARWIWRFWEHAASALERDGLKKLYEEIEQPLVPILARMELDGIRVDSQRLEIFAKELGRDLDNLTREIHRLAGEPFNVNSPKQLAQILFEKLKLPPVKRTKTGYSTDSDVLEQLALGHPLPARILEFRTLAKLKSTYADALPTLINPSTGRIHTSFNQFVTATGRLSSSNPNLQNIPVRTQLGLRIREAFVPEEGCRFVAADYSQIELRILAHCSGEEILIEAFRRGEDIHALTASEVFGVALEAVTPEMRRVAKGINFGVVYGISAFGLSQAAGVTQQGAQKYLDDYFARHPKVRAYIDTTLAAGRENGYVATLMGRRRYLPELKSSNPNARAMAERMAMNAPVQGGASDLIKIAMVKMAEALRSERLSSKMLLQVHDELLFEAPEGEIERLKVLAREVMESAMTLSVPLKVDIKAGPDWSRV
jgi:DNA polymerase-1